MGELRKQTPEPGCLRGERRPPAASWAPPADGCRRRRRRRCLGPTRATPGGFVTGLESRPLDADRPKLDCWRAPIWPRAQQELLAPPKRLPGPGANLVASGGCRRGGAALVAGPRKGQPRRPGLPERGQSGSGSRQWGANLRKLAPRCLRCASASFRPAL